MTLLQFDLKLIKDYKKFIKYMETKYINDNTRRTYITKYAINVLKTVTQTTTVLDSLTKYRKYIKDIEMKLLNENASKVLTDSLENVRKIWLLKFQNEMLKTKPDKIICKALLFTGLYIWIPALRTDFLNSEIKDNKIFIPNLVKRNTSKSKLIDIPNQLNTLIKYHKYLPKIKNSYTTTLSRDSTKLFGQPYSINVFRKLWVDWQKRTNNDLDARIKLSHDMNHSLLTSKYIYERLPKIYS